MVVWAVLALLDARSVSLAYYEKGVCALFLRPYCQL